MSYVMLGLDVSKGYVDALTLDDEGVLGPLERFDDGPNGHDHLLKVLDDLVDRYDTVRVGVESTGGLERSWKRCVNVWRRSHSQYADRVSFSILDARMVKYTAASLGHRGKTDQSSALAIAESLARQSGVGSHDDDPKVEALKGALGALKSAEKHEASLINQIKSLLPQVHPALVGRLSNPGLTDWAIRLLSQYPTAERLSRARVSGLAKIRGITAEKAKSLISEAKKHCMAACGEVYEDHVRFLVNSLAQARDFNTALLKKIEEHVGKTPERDLMESIPGVGPKTSLIMAIETGGFQHFTNADAVIAYCGLDPVFEQSGDGMITKGISHRGPSNLRAVLFTATLVAITCNPVIKAHYHRLRSRGKHHMVAMVACMAKLVRIMYACVMAGKAFDESIHQQNLKRNNQDHRSHEPTGRSTVTNAIQDTCAPISRAEKKRRERAQKQQASDNKRDQSLNADTPAVAGQRALGHRTGKTHVTAKKGLKSKG